MSKHLKFDCGTYPYEVSQIELFRAYINDTAEKHMKTYRIKLLEWDYDKWGNCSDSFHLYTVYLDKQAYGGWVIERNGRIRMVEDTREKAQNKAQELHEAELMKYLEPIE